jgi:ribonuclease P protein component
MTGPAPDSVDRGPARAASDDGSGTAATGAPLGRVRRKGEYDRIFGSGRSATDRLLRVIVARNDAALVRLGTTVSRKSARRAVDRNRIRRRLREAFRRVGPTLPPGLDVVCVPFAQEREPPFADLCASLARLARAALARLPAAPVPSPATATAPASASAEPSSGPVALAASPEGSR